MAETSIRNRMTAAAGLAVACVAGTLLVASPAAAHTGLPVGGALDGATHPLLGTDHLLAMLAVGILAAFAANRRVAWLVPAGFVAGMLVGGAAGLAGLGFPAVEVVIAASVVALGIMIVALKGEFGMWLPLVAAAFGAAHGHAHGAELPAEALPYAYVAGVLAATAALHLSGATLGTGLRRIPSARIAAGGLVAGAGLALLTGV